MAKATQVQGINCDDPLCQAIVTVVKARFSEMCSLRDHALDWSDPEGVHDMRVASRRLRGALKDFAPYLRKRSLNDAISHIQSLADALGDVRDEDVAIVGLQKLAANAPPEVAATLEQLIGVRDRRRAKARRYLRQALNRIALKNKATGFNAAIDSATSKYRPKRSAQRTPEPTYAEVARTIVEERLKEVEELSEAFYQPLKIKPLHKLRIATKRLRYALELFEQCLGAEATTFAKKVARLQTSLGELHDCDVWISAFGKQMEETKSGTKSHTAGSLWLLGHFVRLHSRHLRTAISQWQEWESSGTSQLLRNLLIQPAAKPTLPKVKKLAAPKTIVTPLGTESVSSEQSAETTAASQS
jgi:CHAD domain-containing protein